MPQTPAYSTDDLCRLSGLTYRQADYLARTAVLIPSVRHTRGSGNHRRWSANDVRAATALGVLSKLGLAGDVRLRVGRWLASCDTWTARVAFDADGVACHPEAVSAGWLVDLAEIAGRLDEYVAVA